MAADEWFADRLLWVIKSTKADIQAYVILGWLCALETTLQQKIA